MIDSADAWQAYLARQPDEARALARRVSADVDHALSLQREQVATLTDLTRGWLRELAARGT